MKTSVISLLVAVIFLTGISFSQSTEELQKQVEALKAQLKQLEEKVAAMQKAPEAEAPPATSNEELDTRLSKVEAQTAQNRISWGGDFRVRFDNVGWHINPYQQFMGTQNPPVPMPAQNWANPMQWSLRMRLRMNAQVSDNIKFMGRLTMYKLYGGGEVPVFNGFPDTVANSFNSVSIPSADILHVERALLKIDFPGTPMTLALGRMNSSDGPPLELREGTERQATPMAMMVNAEVDGAHFDYHLDKLGLPEGAVIGVCAGIGYESGFGGGGQVKENYTMTPFGMGHISGMKDSGVVGLIFEVPYMFESNGLVHNTFLMFGYNRFLRMTDIPYGALINFPVPGPYAQPSPQYVTGTDNLGDMDQLGWLWQHRLGDKFTYFYSGGMIKSHPNGKVSQYGFGGLLGNPNHSETGIGHYLGVKWTPRPVFALGAEFNHGSPRWFNYTPATGEPNEKLAARGNVWEGYLHWEFMKHALLKLGYIHYDYSTAFSGWHIAPGDLSYYSLDNPNAVNFYAFPKTVGNVYLILEARF